MATEVHNQTEPSVTSLVSGILSDVQDLFKQQLQLTRKEIEADLRNARQAASLFAIGCAICLVGAIGLCSMAAHLLHWLGAPPGADPSTVPMWVGYAVVGGLVSLTGIFTLFAAKTKADAASKPLHQTARALKENLEWKTTTKTY